MKEHNHLVTTAGICNMFERDLKERFAHQRELTYDVQQLFQWMDHLVSSHACCLYFTAPAVTHGTMNESVARFCPY